MMLKKLTIYIVLAVLCPFLGVAQGAGAGAVDVTLKGLQIGQKVPEVLLSGLHNYKDAGGKSVSSAKLSDFRGKLLILDFWATWCSPCVAMIPKMDSLQKEFGGKIQFLSVTYQSEKEVLPFLEKFEKQQAVKSNLALLTGDKELKKLFPHRTLPHYVWIDGDGVFRAVTESSKVEAVFIKQFLDGGSQGWVKKIDVERRAYNKELPMFLGNNAGAPSDLIFHSMLSGYTEGMGSGLSYYGSEYKKGQKITARNLTVKSLFSLAYSDYKVNLNGNRLVFEVKDPGKLTSKLTGMEYLNWMRQGNGFCYELVVPVALRDSAFGLMRNDLNRHFTQYKIGVEERVMECWVLQVVDKGLKNRVWTKGAAPFIKLNVTGGKLINTPISKLVNSLDRFYMQKSLYPIIDGTGLANVDLDLDCSLTSMDELNGALTRYGLKFSKAFQKVPLLVFRDNVAAGFGVGEAVRWGGGKR